jgi:hypothetical protein
MESLRRSLPAIAVVFRNPEMRLLQLAWAAESLAIWSFAIALGVYAFDAAGTTAVGIAALVRLLPGALEKISREVRRYAHADLCPHVESST